MDYATWSFSKRNNNFILSYTECKDAHTGKNEQEIKSFIINSPIVYLQIKVDTTGTCRFMYSLDDIKYIDIGIPFKAREGRWIGAKTGLFATSNEETGIKGFARFEYFRIE